MPNTYAYVRVSDENRQDNATQKSRISDYAAEQRIIIKRWFEIGASGSKAGREQRGINSLFEILKPGDQLIISDIARLGRDSLSDTIEIITRLINNDITLHLAYSNQTIAPADRNDLPKIFIAIGEAYAAVQGAKERSQKAKAAIERRRKSGLPVGLPKGTIVKSRLDALEPVIINLLNQQYSEYYIAEHVRSHRHTLRNWLKRRDELIKEAKHTGCWQAQMSISDIKQALKRRPKTQ